MDDVNPSGKRKRSRVLRATDVIPPFDKSIPPSDNGPVGAGPCACPTPGQPQGVAPTAGDNQDGLERCFAPSATGGIEPLPANDAEIPAYDLAANILAEQRRAAGKRRRRPGRTEAGPAAALPGGGVGLPSAPNLASHHLLELQRIVTEIVARDIERLCRRPERPAHVRL